MGIPLVALQGQGPEIAKSLGDLGTRQLDLRKLLDEQKVRQQGMQLNDLAIQKAQQQQTSQAASMRAFKDSGGDPEQYFKLATQYGVGTDDVDKQMSALDNYKKAGLARTAAEQTQAEAKTKAIGDTMANIHALPEEARAAAMPKAVHQLVLDGWMKPDEAQPYMQYQGADWLDQVGATFNFHSQIEKQIADQRLAADEVRKQAEESRKAAEFEWRKQHGYASLTESPKESLQRQLVDAQNQGDTATASKLSDQLKAIDPAAQQRVQISQGNLDERQAAATRSEIRDHDKAYVQPAETVEKSYQMMQDAYNEYKDARAKGKELPTGAQSMLALATHLTTTFGNVKGARVTRDMIQEHLGARGISDKALVAVQNLTNGDRLSPDQWEAFNDMVSNSRKLSWDTAVKEAKRKNIPVDFLPPDLAGGGAAPKANEKDPLGIL